MLAAACASAFAPRSAAKPSGIRREIFLASPGKGTAVVASAYYTKSQGGEMLSVEQRWSRSDTVDVAFYRFSSDYGKTWSAPVERRTGERRAAGMLRRHLAGGWVDPSNGRFIELWNEAILPNDDPLEGLKQWNIFYALSEDGGRSHHDVRQIIHKGEEFDARHPLPGVYTGKNAVTLGDTASMPLRLGDGSILIPVEITPIKPDGSLYNPGGGYTYGDSAVLIGRWKGAAIEWEMGDRIIGDPERTTRGMLEPTVATLKDGRVMIVMRGSNDKKTSLPAHKWVSYSRDGGRLWTKPVPWTYTTGETFFSPSACSQLVPHSSGRLFWLGNISPENAKGNRPRYPFVVGEVDLDSGRLIRDRVRVVDDKSEEDDPVLMLSNFFAREDRQTKEIALHMSRVFAFPDGWVGDAFLYRIAID
jgi:hypothetical protein